MNESTSWSYTDKYVNPEEGMSIAMSKLSGGFPYSAWGTQNPYKAVMRDRDEGLHSLIEMNICSCGLTIDPKKDSRLMAIVLTPHHRNHTTLRHEPKPKFRGEVGNRLSPRSFGPRFKPDIKWDLIVDALEKQSSSETFETFKKLEFQVHTNDSTGESSVSCASCGEQEDNTQTELEKLLLKHLKKHLGGISA